MTGIRSATKRYVGVAIFALVCAIQATSAAPAETAAPTPAAPTSGTGAASIGAPPVAANAEVVGFRSAHFGMSEADVRAAIAKDFGISGDSVKSAQNGVEHTQILSVKAPDVLQDGGSAEVAYVLGYKSKKLIEVSVSWSKATDDKVTAERLLSNGETLRAYFLSAGYKPDSIVNGAAVANGLLMFRGSDADGHTTILLLRGVQGPDKDKSQHTFSPTGLTLFYLADVKNPDVYRVAPGKF